MRKQGLIVLPLNTSLLCFLKEEARNPKFLFNSIGMLAMHDLDHVLNDKADRGDMGGDMLGHAGSPVVCDSFTVDSRSGCESPHFAPAAGLSGGVPS